MPEPVDMNFVTTDVAGGSVLQWATTFTGVKDMVDKAIAKLKPGECIRRLVIAGHGADHTDGFFVFDPDVAGNQLIDGSTKREPISPQVVKELQRLRAHFCKDAIIEFRVCRFGEGTNGQKAMQAVADAVGVAVTAPVGSISSLALIGGLATNWRVAYPVAWGMPVSTSFWRGEPTRPPAGAALPADIAPITGQVVPLRSVTTPGAPDLFMTPPATLPPIGRISIANPQPGGVTRGVATAGTLLVVGAGAVIGWSVFSTPPGQVPSASPTAPPAAVATATPRASTTASPATAATATPTAAPTPTASPPPTPAVALLPADGSYRASGTFASYDGAQSFETHWLLRKAGFEIVVTQLVAPAGPPFQVVGGIVDPTGLVVAVNDSSDFCEVLVFPYGGGEWSNELFSAFGPPTMTCPDTIEVATFFRTLAVDPTERDTALRKAFDWGADVTIGSVATGGWTLDAP